MITRRTWLSRAALIAAGTALADRLGFARTAADQPANSPSHHHGPHPQAPSKPLPSDRRYRPVVTPNGSTLPYEVKAGVKEFRLVAEVADVEVAPGMKARVWGYNGGTPGPTIEAVEGDRVRILVTNRLPEPTSIHWHGIFLPNGMDGVAGLTQPHIQPGETFAYEFTLRQWGTYMYHPHADEMVQMALGLMGFFIIHPRDPEESPVDRDFCVFPHMWAIAPGTKTPNPSVMLDFNLFTFNGRVYPGTAPLVVRTGDRVRIRIANLSMTSHPLHFHGARAWVTHTDGGPIPRSAQWPETTINVAPGQTRAFEFVADEPGDWPLHCHKTHHAMNAMGHDVPNMIGVDQSGIDREISRLVNGYMAMGSTGMSEHAAHAEHMPGVENTLPMMMGQGPFGPLEMGGMFTIIKVRDGLTSYETDPPWYEHPAGTVAWKVEGESTAEPAHQHHEHDHG